MKITICGSIRYKDEIIRQYNKLTALGHIVYLPLLKEIKQPEGETTNQRFLNYIDILHKVHEEKIIDSDMILVVDTDGNNYAAYYGDDTKREIDFAIRHDKNVLFLSNKETKKLFKGEM